jgi:hypothetical protein
MPSKRPTDPPPPPRKNTKVTGERSESDFQSAAIHRNFGVAKPWGDSRRYDFILDNGLCLYRVQVKCTEAIRAAAYETRATYTVGKKRAVYTKKDIDFIAAHVVPLNIWYIIPVEICTPAPMLRFYPHRKAKRMRLEPYREAWHLLEGTDHAPKIELQASADETIYEEMLDDDATDAHGETNANSTSNHVGTDAFVRPPSEARRAKSNADAPPVHLPPDAAPWPTPPLRILATRKGRHILPNPRET